VKILIKSSKEDSVPYCVDEYATLTLDGATEVSGFDIAYTIDDDETTVLPRVEEPFTSVIDEASYDTLMNICREALYQTIDF
jgi:hypothetical protein